MKNVADPRLDMLYLYQKKNIIDWKTQLQKHVALSSAEAEYVALSRVCREIVSIKALANELFDFSAKPIVYEDNRAAIKLSKTEEVKTFKHLVHVKYHYVRNLYLDKVIKIKWVPTAEQLADFFTKAQPAPKFLVNRNIIMNI